MVAIPRAGVGQDANSNVLLAGLWPVFLTQEVRVLCLCELAPTRRDMTYAFLSINRTKGIHGDLPFQVPGICTQGKAPLDGSGQGDYG